MKARYINMKKLLCIVLVLLFCACACAEPADFILPIGLPFGATLDEVKAIDPDLNEHKLISQTVYIGFAPTELWGCGIENHNYIFDGNGGLRYYVSGILPEYTTAFEEALKESYSEMMHVTADGMMLGYNSVTGELKEERWVPVEQIIADYAAEGFETRLISQYLVNTDAGYVGIIIEDVAMGEGEEYYEFSACYFTLLSDAACEILAADPKISC